MAGPVEINDVDALKRLRAQIAKSAEVLSAAVADAASDVQRTQQWLDHEQSLKWKLEQRKRHDKLQQALEQLRMKQLYKGPTGERQSTVDEEKRVKQCRAALEEAELKLKAIARHKIQLSREALLFQGCLTRIGTIAHDSAPAALAELGQLLLALERYTQGGAQEVGSSAGAVAGAEVEPGMARGTDAASAEGTQSEASSAQPEAVWEAFVEKARQVLLRVREGEVIVEEGLDWSGTAAIWKDGFTGRMYAGVLGPAVPRQEIVVLTRVELLAAVPGVAETVAQEGDRRALFESRERVFHG